MNQLYNLKIGLFALGGYFVLTKVIRDTMLLAFPPWRCSRFRNVESEVEVFHSWDSWKIVSPCCVGSGSTHRASGLGEADAWRRGGQAGPWNTAQV